MVVQGGFGCSNPASVQGLAGQSLEQAGIVEEVRAHGRNFGTRGALKSIPTPLKFVDPVFLGPHQC